MYINPLLRFPSPLRPSTSVEGDFVCIHYLMRRFLDKTYSFFSKNHSMTGIRRKATIPSVKPPL